MGIRLKWAFRDDVKLRKPELDGGKGPFSRYFSVFLSFLLKFPIFYYPFFYPLFLAERPEFRAGLNYIHEDLDPAARRWNTKDRVRVKMLLRAGWEQSEIHRG